MFGTAFILLVLRTTTSSLLSPFEKQEALTRLLGKMKRTPLLLLLATFAVACAVLAPTVTARVGDSWGTNIHWTSETQPGEAAMLAKAFKLARMDLIWSAVEHKCGQYDFSAYKTLLQEMKTNGIRPYWILDYCNPCYPGTRPNSCDTPQCITAYGNFARAAVDTFKGNNIIFESVNEPNGMGKDNATTIARLIEAAWPHFQKAGETFVGPATSGIPLLYLYEAFKSGILNSLSGISVHPYRGNVPETALINYGELHEMLKLFKSDLPIIDGEWGYTSAGPPCSYGDRTDIVRQGHYVPRMWLTSALAGVHTCISYDWHDDGPDKTVCEQNFGSVYNKATGNVSQPFDPKPAYIAALTIQQGIGNADRFDKKVKWTSAGGLEPFWDIYVARFVTNSATAFARGNQPDEYAVWQAGSDTSASYKIKFSTGKSAQRCWNHVGVFGESLGMVCSDASGEVEVEATSGPSYLL